MPYLDPDEEEKIEEKNIGVQNGAVNKLIVEIHSSEDTSLKDSTPASFWSRALDLSQSWATTSFNIAKICVFAIFIISIALILAKIFAQEGTVVLPFEVNGNENISGIAIADQLTAELTQIQKIHGIKHGAITFWTNTASSTTQTSTAFITSRFSTEYALGNREMVVPKAETVEFGMGEIGSIDTGSGSLSIGRLVIAFQNLLPGLKSITTIRGSLQRYGSSIVLVGLLEGDKVQSWIITRPSDDNENQSLEMIRSLAFMIALDQQQSDLSVKTWEGLKYYTEALDAYHRYLLTGDPNFLYLAGNNSLETIKAEKGYQNVYDLLMSIESIFIMLGKNNDVLEYCNKTIELDPLYLNGWINKGNSLFILGEYDESVEAYDEAIKLDPKYAIAWNSKGNSLFILGEYNESVEAYDEAIKLDPKYADAWGNKGNSLYSQDKYDEAIEAIDEAIKLDPKSANFWNNKGNSLYSQDKYDEAIEAYDEAVKLNPKSAIAWNGKGDSLYSQDKYDEAIEAYDEAIKLDPKYANAWTGKGNSFYSQGKYDDAIGAYDEAIKLDPKYANAWNGKGSSLYSQGKYDKAVEAYDEAIRLNPNFAVAWYNKGNALFNKGKTTEARTAFNKSKELGFEGPFPL